MAQSKFTLYEYIKLAEGSWRYCKAAFYSNGKIKPNRCIVDGKEEEHPEGAYYLYHDRKWIPAGTDALEAQRQRNARLDEEELKHLRGTAAVQAWDTAPTCSKTSLATAAGRYFSNLEAQDADPKTIRTYRSAVDPFVAHCKKFYVEDVTKQDLINFMGWLRKQPLPKRKNSNPERTYANKVGHVAIVLKAFGVSCLLKKSEYPQYEEKMVTAPTDEELDWLYSHADDEGRFLLEFGLSMSYTVKDGETWETIARAHGLKSSDLIFANFGTHDCLEINWYLHHYVGCPLPTGDGKNWRFSSHANPGIIHIPLRTLVMPPLVIEGHLEGRASILKNVWAGAGKSHSGDLFVIGAQDMTAKVYNLGDRAPNIRNAVININGYKFGPGLGADVSAVFVMAVGFENAKDMIGVDGDKDFDIALGTRLSDFLKGLKYLGRGIESL